jgi:hypothetical protein
MGTKVMAIGAEGTFGKHQEWCPAFVTGAQGYRLFIIVGTAADRIIDGIDTTPGERITVEEQETLTRRVINHFTSSAE